jgi:hypothetical protein
MFKNIFSKFSKYFKSPLKYLIVDFEEQTGILTFLFRGGRATFKKNLSDAIVDNNLITGLLPEQACFLGLLWGKSVKTRTQASNHDHVINNTYTNTGTLEQIAFDRMGNLIFFDRKENQLKKEKAVIIAASQTYINQFDSISAKEIGIFVGMRLHKKIISADIEGVISFPEDKNIVSIKAAHMKLK